MPRGGFFAGAVVLLLLGLAGLLVFLLFQFDNLERRLIHQSHQLQALGDATDRLTGQVERLVRAGGVDTAALPREAASTPAAMLRHPEVENFLEQSDSRWPPAGASTTGVLVRGWSSGDPKGFNPLIENAADLNGLIALYVASSLADRMVWTDPDRWAGDLAWRVEITDDFIVQMVLKNGKRIYMKS